MIGCLSLPIPDCKSNRDYTVDLFIPPSQNRYYIVSCESQIIRESNQKRSVIGAGVEHRHHSSGLQTCLHRSSKVEIPYPYSCPTECIAPVERTRQSFAQCCRILLPARGPEVATLVLPAQVKVLRATRATQKGVLLHVERHESRRLLPFCAVGAHVCGSRVASIKLDQRR